MRFVTHHCMHHYSYCFTLFNFKSGYVINSRPFLEIGPIRLQKLHTIKSLFKTKKMTNEIALRANISIIFIIVNYFDNPGKNTLLRNG